MSEEKAADRPIDPQKLLRIASLARELLEEIRRTSPDDTVAENLGKIYQRVQDQLEQALPKSLMEELKSMKLDFAFDDGASPKEVMVAYSALIGWLTGLFQGIQAATVQGQTMMTGPPPNEAIAGPPETEPGEQEGYL